MKQWYKSKERGRGNSQEGKEHEKPNKGPYHVTNCYLNLSPHLAVCYCNIRYPDNSSLAWPCSGFQSIFENCVANGWSAGLATHNSTGCCFIHICSTGHPYSSTFDALPLWLLFIPLKSSGSQVQFANYSGCSESDIKSSETLATLLIISVIAVTMWDKTVMLGEGTEAWLASTVDKHGIEKPLTKPQMLY